jgi:hypothetical protein
VACSAAACCPADEGWPASSRLLYTVVDICCACAGPSAALEHACSLLDLVPPPSRTMLANAEAVATLGRAVARISATAAAAAADVGSHPGKLLQQTLPVLCHLASRLLRTLSPDSVRSHCLDGNSSSSSSVPAGAASAPLTSQEVASALFLLVLLARSAVLCSDAAAAAAAGSDMSRQRYCSDVLLPCVAVLGCSLLHMVQQSQSTWAPAQSAEAAAVDVTRSDDTATGWGPAWRCQTFSECAGPSMPLDHT